MDFTLLGQRRLRQIFAAMEAATAANFPDEMDMRSTDIGRSVMDSMGEVVDDLLPPRLSAGEWATLHALALSFSKRGTQ